MFLKSSISEFPFFPFKGRGGGVQGQNFFSFFILCYSPGYSPGYKQGHLSPNSHWFPRYDATKLGTMCAIFGHFFWAKSVKNFPRQPVFRATGVGGLIGLKLGIYLETNNTYGTA